MALGIASNVLTNRLKRLCDEELLERVPAAHRPGTLSRSRLSDAMVVRNVGGRVTPEVINDVAFIGQFAENLLPDGPLFEVAVTHHTQCGAGALADDTFRHRYAELWVSGAIALLAIPVTFLLIRKDELATAVATTALRDPQPELAT